MSYISISCATPNRLDGSARAILKESICLRAPAQEDKGMKRYFRSKSNGKGLCDKGKVLDSDLRQPEHMRPKD